MLYDSTDPISIENHAKVLENKTFYEVLPEDEIKKSSIKGGLGQLIEEYHFGYKPNNNSAPDFPEAGVELKLTPYKRNKNKSFSAKERLVLSIIDYFSVVNETFENSSFWNKNKLLLLIFYLYEANVERGNLKITHSQLFQFPEKDLKIIKDDWERIVEKIRHGKAHELSEADTNYLGACTKGANKNSLRKQPFSDKPAMQRAFSLKSSYMTFILNKYILKRKQTYTPIVNQAIDMSIEDYILGVYEKYFGKTLSELCNLFDVSKSSKAKTYLVAAKMLNTNLKDLNKSEEFIKSNTKIKAIRIQKNGKIKESMSFPTFKYTEIIQETWEESELRNMFLETRFLFVIFRETQNGDYIFEDAMFWRMPLEDLENDVKWVWEETVTRIKMGEYKNLPKISDNDVAHVRPHANNSKDTYPTPCGNHEVKKCFWLDRKYILKQIMMKKKEESRVI
jgi:DNA mismatch repair protein MutH